MKELVEQAVLLQVTHEQADGALNGQVQSGKWKAYAEYKDSGVGWLGRIPACWGRIKLKYLTHLNYGDALPSGQRVDGDNLVYGSNGPVGKHSEVNTSSPVIIIGRKGSFGKITYSEKSCFAIDTTYYIDSTRREVSIRWLFYVLKLLKLDEFTEDSAIPGLSREYVYSHTVPLLNISEQNIIASFLDRETTRINTLITKKEQHIALLQERRTAIINQAVTKGLNADVPMKDSGVEWLGEIPAHWEVRRVKYSIYSIGQGWSPSCGNRVADADEWGVLKVGCVNGTVFNENENKALPKELKPIPELEIKPGDILMSRANTRELLGSASLVRDVRPRLLLCDKLYRLRIKPEILSPDFFVLIMRSSTVRFQLERDATGASSSMQNISQFTIVNVLLPVPDIKEQQAIVTYIEQETTKIDKLITGIQESIKKLKEYSTALISAAVTGKIDVRGEVADAGELGTGVGGRRGKLGC